MSEQKNCNFYVIELLEPPFTNRERYVCVPKSWLRLRETSDIALVKFPVEDLLKIKKRAAKGEFSDNSTVLLAVIKYCTNSYKDAIDYTKILNKISVQKESSLKVVEDMPSTSNKKVLESQSSSETNEVRTTSTLNSDAGPVSKEIPKQLNLPLSGNNTVNLPDQTTKENHPDTRHCVEETDKTNSNQENESSAKKSLELVMKSQIVMALRSFFGDDFKEALKHLHDKFENNQLLLEHLQLALMENCKIIKGLIELTDEINNGPDISDLDSVIKQLENGMMEVNINENNSNEVTGSKVQNDTQKKEEKKHNSDGTEVKNNNPLNKIRGQARKFTLPPEYDPNDSRWTLKHREKKEGLVELLPHSRVYIDAIQLRKCKIMSKDIRTLARMLLLEIFTKNALSVCSLTGKKANAYDFEGTSVRPGLDGQARTALLNYVQKHAREQKWVESDSQMISNTLRNKMQEMRGKHRNIVEK